ncbi:MAG TPA: ribonuclease P protein component [Candidatus Kapabacteria bacterium]|nr:ribonuclease P protein component [Candidatus Kapabacteria bacterium]
MLAIDRRHSFSGQKNLDWFFANRKWVRVSVKGVASKSIVEAAWASRSLPEGEAGVRFLLLAPKRNYKHAHDRNKIRRWLRAAISEVELFARIEDRMQESSQQSIVMMRVSKPLPNLNWSAILDDVRKIAERLSEL